MFMRSSILGLERSFGLPVAVFPPPFPRESTSGCVRMLLSPTRVLRRRAQGQPFGRDERFGDGNRPSVGGRDGSRCHFAGDR